MAAQQEQADGQIVADGQSQAEGEDGMMVVLHIYDISHGMAKQFSQPLLGKPLEGIWHTGIVCYGKEFYFGAGITADNPGQTPFGDPTEVKELGPTQVSVRLFDDYLNQLRPRYTADTYHLLDNNCNNFTQDVAIFLTGLGIPRKIVGLPEDAIDSPLGKLIRPLIENMERMLKGSTNPGANNASAPSQEAAAAQSSVFLVNTSQPSLFTLGNLPTITLKLQAFNAQVDDSIQLTEREDEELDALVEYLSQEPEYSHPVSPGAYQLLERIICTWPPMYLYPAVDLLRLLVLWLEASLHYSTAPGSEVLVHLITLALDGTPDQQRCPAALVLMVLRLVNNMFATDESYRAILSPELGPKVIQLAIDNMVSSNVEISKACATILFNSSSKLDAVGQHMPDCVVKCVAALMHAIPLTDNDDCLFRLLMALGRILWHDAVAVELVRLGDFDIGRHLENDAEHIKLVAHEIKAIIAR